MGRFNGGTIGTILALTGAESHSTLSLYLNNGQERHYSTANASFSAGGKTFSPGLVMASELSQVIGSQPSRVPVSIDNVDGSIGADVKAELLVRAPATLGRFYRTASGLTAWTELFPGEAIVSDTLEAAVELEVLSDLTAKGSCIADRSLAAACPFKFKGPQCGYTGSKTTCSKTRKGPNGCQEHDVETDDYKFGGWEYPDIQPSEIGSGVGSGGVGGIKGPCFPAGTLILMADFTEKPIEQVRVGDWILSWKDDWSPVPARVLKTFVHPGTDRLTDIDGGLITPTPNHGFYDPGMRKKPIGTYRTGEKLRRLRGDWLLGPFWVDWTIESRRSIVLRKEIDTFNFQVETYGRYIANRFAVSNSKFIGPDTL